MVMSQARFGLTNAELARRLHRPTRATLQLLRDFEAVGIAVEHYGEWRLTSEGEATYGRLMRELPLDLEVVVN